jgi:hypothetical protein
MIKHGNKLIMRPNKVSIRPEISGIRDGDNLSFEERFQNKTIRPIVKLQHDIIIAYFNEYLSVMNCDYEVFSSLRKKDYIFKMFNRDNSFKLKLKGIIIGHFTRDEFIDYCYSKNDFNKRILTIIKERIISVVI